MQEMPSICSSSALTISVSILVTGQDWVCVSVDVFRFWERHFD